MAASKVSLKLLIDKQNHKFLFAEAGKDFVDFLISLLSLPVGTVIKLLTKQSMVGSLGNLYDSIENMSEIYMQPNQDKNSLLNPKVLAAGAPFFLLDNVSAVKSKNFYRCSKNYNHPNIADEPGAGCPDCGNSMSSEVRYVPRVVAKDKEAAVADDQEGYVKGVVTYMVTDDLLVQPMSTISGVTLLKKFNVKDLGALEERVVHFGMKEGLKMLKASLQSKKVFTSVFLWNPLPIKGLPNLPPK